MERHKTLEVILPQSSMLSPETISQLDDLFQFSAPSRIRAHLQELLFSYLMHEHECLPNDFEEMVADLQFLFEFLDGVEEERKTQKFST